MPKTKRDFKMPTLEKKLLPGDLYSYISIFIVSFLSSQYGIMEMKTAVD